MKATLLFCFIICAALFTGCSEDDEVATLAEGQGEVTFKFVRNKVFTISTLEDMARLKVTLEKDGKKIDLKTVDLTGNEDELTSEVLALEEGTYQVVKYVAYDNKGAQIQEAYVDDENSVTVKHGEMATFYFPISIRFVYVNNQLRNQLFGLCEQVLGTDSTKWPKTWRVENEDLLTWENLEFEVDDYGNISYLATIIFDNKAFPGMKKLPGLISTFSTLEGIQILDIPEFEELPENLDKSTLYAILIMNTGFKDFPKNFEKMKNLRSLTVVNSQLTELPARLGELPELRDLEISGNSISEFPAALAEKLQKVVSLRMNDTKLTTLPSNMFSMKMVSTFDFRNNPNLNSMPESRGEGVRMGGLLLDNCGFTSIPKIAKGRLHTLTLANNKITSVTESELNALSGELATLILDGNKINAFPKMNSESLMELKLNNCGLSAIPNLSALPNLRSLALAKNNITAIGDGVFSKNPYLSILDFSDNAGLTSFSENTGIYLREQEDVIGESVKNVSKPFYLHCVNVDNCPALNWQVPATWCCIENFKMENKEDLLLPRRNVIVYNRNSSGVTRATCPVDGCKATYALPRDFDEYLESIKKKLNE
ncbi:leucine-rich repeat domain-containing protein [Bacteroides sp. GM023]|uniref:leucine-rich repeat domain-containing protein n=1 Tax=Bacteroides sp. GM023 TaxID=2723058 RepID=UPI00168B27EE|nr:leucine-rich repeat domain-containing protein [Bacteroides sp. GM023]MBD3590085.1 DUF4458 domain-containing protein [Bacteroides sp. GM023]